MRCNKQELHAIASQTSQNYDREGVLVLKERQDSFFRRSEGCYLRWFRLKGNLLFYLKGPESWYEPMGVIVLGHHQVTLKAQDENGHWPFQIEWENGVCYRMSTFHESDRTQWINAIEMASHDNMSTQLTELQEKLNRLRPVIDLSSYRMQKGIMTDMNEVPLCELALSCDNLLCDTHGRPPSPMIVVYVIYSKVLSVKYGSTEVVETCSNPCFSRTILFRASDDLTGDEQVHIVVYDMKERVSETTVPMGFTELPLSTIQEAQRLRVNLMTRENKTVGFVTMNGWSLEPSYIETSPQHSNDMNSIEIPQKVLCHRRSQSLPPRLGLKLKFPSYGNIFKQNFMNSHQVTYRFHSGLGGDITVHEIMAEPKLCYQLPMQLLDIYIQREKELLEELLSVGEMCSQWQTRQLDLVSIHISMLKHFCHSKRCMEQVENNYLKPSSKKDESSLEFAPVNLHLQRMWVHNDTLNKSGFHDVITVGAFTAHTHKSERSGGLINLVQQVKNANSSKAELNYASKIHSEYDNVLAMARLREEITNDLGHVMMLAQANEGREVLDLMNSIKGKVRSILALWDHKAVEEAISYIGWPKNNSTKETDNETLNTITRLTEQMNMFETMGFGSETFDASAKSSSKEASPTINFPSITSSVPNISPSSSKNDATHTEGSGLHFHNDYFKSEQEQRGSWHQSFRSARSGPPKLNEAQSLSFESSTSRPCTFRSKFKSSASLEQVSYRNLMDNLSASDNKNSLPRRDRESANLNLGTSLNEPTARENNLAYFKNVGINISNNFDSLLEGLLQYLDINTGYMTHDDLKIIQSDIEALRTSTDEAGRWLRISHAALRLRYETPPIAREYASLQTRRDTCFSQALATVTTGLLCWLSSVPADIVVKILTRGLGPLCGFEGLLSLYSTEKAMWGDMVVAVEDLQTVVFKLTRAGHGNSANPQVKGTRGSIVVHIPVSDSLFNKIFEKEHLSFTITAVFFNIGINEKATLAEALGETTPQYHSNRDNLDRIYKYYHKYRRIFPIDHIAANRASSRTKPLEEVMENLKKSVHKKIPKNVGLLHQAATATRLMNGIRFTSCKSAKDRTGMAVTLEQSSILSTEYHLAEHEMAKALDIMRSEGCRRENTFKNIGVRKYAFTKKQVSSLPENYRPPPGTYGSLQT